MKQYILLSDYGPLKKDDLLFPCSAYQAPVPYATQSEINKDGGPVNMWFESFLKEHPEVFKEINP